MPGVIELGEVTPYHFGKKLIIGLDERWSEYFSSKNETFKVVISNNKLMLIGPRVSSQDTITKSTDSKQEISNIV